MEPAAKPESMTARKMQNRMSSGIWAQQGERSGGGGSGRGSFGSSRVLLRGIYGRYLGAPEPSGPLHHRAAVQRAQDERELRAIMWRAASGAGVVLLHDAHGRFLRTNWKRLPCRAGVAVGDGCCVGPTMKWAVEAIPSKHGQPEFALARDPEWVELFRRACPSPLADLYRWA